MFIRFLNTYEPVTSFYRDLLPVLADRGMRTEVLLSSSEYRKGRGSLEAILNGKSRVKYASTVGLKLKGKIKKSWEMLSYIFYCCFRSLLSRGDAFNCFLSQPPMYSIWGYVLKRLRKQPYYCLVMDVYPDVAVKGGLLNKHSLIVSIMHKLMLHALNNADKIIVIGRCMKDNLLKYNIDSSKLLMINNWANEEAIYPVPKENNPLRSELGLDDKFVVLYSGNIGASHFFDDILLVARRLREDDKVRFIFIGNGARTREIQQVKEKYNLKNLIILPFQPIEKLKYSLCLGDVHFISLREGFEGLVVPSKAYGVMAAGRPIIYQGNDRGEIARMIIEEDIGSVVPQGDSEQLLEAILGYKQNPSLVRTQGEQARQLIKTRYSKNQAVDKYVQIIESIL